LLFNAGQAAQTFMLPAPPAGNGWICRFDTACGIPEGQVPGSGLALALAASSAALLEC
jgi:hypothetical protein